MSGSPQPKSGGRRRARTGGRHSAARLAAVQALYQLEMSDAGVGDVVQEFIDLRLDGDSGIDGVAAPKADKRLFAQLVNGVAVRRDEYEAMIASALDKDRTPDRLEVLLRCILLLGAFEFAARADVPARVVITEYVDLADAFFSGNEPAMANGVLDRLARTLRPDEMGSG